MTQPDPLALAALYRDIFETDVRGRQVFEHLSRLFAKPPDLSGTQDALLVSYVRAAQREVLDHILRQIARANGEPTTEPPPAGEPGTLLLGDQ